MASADPDQLTLLLRRLRNGDSSAVEQVVTIIYPELKRLAARQLRRERPNHLLEPTALVNEAYMRLVTHDDQNWHNRAHFFGAAANTMRRVLVDYARAGGAAKRTHDRATTVTLDQLVADAHGAENLVALDDALAALDQLAPRQAKIVELRYFVGLTVAEIAEVLGVTSRTVDRDWSAARTWLRLHLQR